MNPLWLLLIVPASMVAGAILLPPVMCFVLGIPWVTWND